MPSKARRGHPLRPGMELYAVVSYLTWALGTELRSSAKQQLLLTTEPPYHQFPHFY